MKNLLAVDTGKKGGMVYNIGDQVFARPHKEDEDITPLLRTLPLFDRIYLEVASSSRQQGVVSAFSSGENYGRWQGLLAWVAPEDTGIDLLPSQSWIRWLKTKVTNYPERPLSMTRPAYYQLMKGYNKEVAQGWFPDIKVTLAIADALLIWSYAKSKIQNNTEKEYDETNTEMGN